MPLPLLFIIPAAIGGAVGAGKTIKAAVDNSNAKDINASANRVVECAKETINFAREESGKSLEHLGAKKLYVLNNDIEKFVESFEKLKNVELENSVGLEELNKFKIDKAALKELREMGSFASSFAGGVAGGTVGGALTAFGAYGAAMTFGAASTGTAIATLSGAAATNATLAFFGGGSLAAGGLGIAGGTAVLGGLVAAPALLVLGFVTGAKASANLDNAYSNLAKAREFETEMETAAVACNGIRRRAYMFYRLLVRIDAIFAPLLSQMSSVMEKSGTDFSSYSADEKHTIAAAASMAGTVKAILDTPILTEDGKLTAESEKIANEVNNALAIEECK